MLPLGVGMMVEYKRSVKIKTALILIVIMSIMGWIYECAFYSFSEGEFIRRGSGLGPWLPIYGAGTALYLLATSMKEISSTKAFIIGSLGSGILEFATGWGLYHFADGLRLWDYNTEIWNWGNIGGYVCMRSVLLFGIAAVLVQKYLIPALLKFVEKLGERKSLIISVVLSSLFIIDFLFCYLLLPNIR